MLVVSNIDVTSILIDSHETPSDIDGHCIALHCITLPEAMYFVSLNTLQNLPHSYHKQCSSVDPQSGDASISCHRSLLLKGELLYSGRGSVASRLGRCVRLVLSWSVHRLAEFSESLGGVQRIILCHNLNLFKLHHCIAELPST